MELAVRDDEEILKLNIVDEKQYVLVPSSDVSENDLQALKEHDSSYIV